MLERMEIGLNLTITENLLLCKIDKKNLESFVPIVEVFTDKDVYELGEIINFKAILKYEEVLDNFFSIWFFRSKRTSLYLCKWYLGRKRSKL